MFYGENGTKISKTRTTHTNMRKNLINGLQNQKNGYNRY